MLGFAFVVGTSTGCNRAVHKPAADRSIVTVSVAASTRDVVESIAHTFAAESGVRIRINSGSSSQLANQILAGAPADLFLSASPHWAEMVAETEVTVTSTELLGNRLVIVVPEGNPHKVGSAMDLTEARIARIALAAEQVPAGMYADQALRSLGIREALVRDNKIVRCQNVRSALSFVEREETEAGIVYATDALVSSAVEVAVTIDSGQHEPIVYPLVLLNSSKQSAAHRFFEYLGSDAARSKFVSFGFRPLP